MDALFTPLHASAKAHTSIVDAVNKQCSPRFRQPCRVKIGGPRKVPVCHTEPEWYVCGRVAYTLFGCTIFTSHVKLFAVYPATSAGLGYVDCYLEDVTMRRLVEETLREQAQLLKVNIFLSDVVRGTPCNLRQFHPLADAADASS